MHDRIAELNTADKVKAAQAKVDTKFFDKLWKELSPLQQNTVKAMTGAGVLIGIGMIGYAMWHVGDPVYYFEGRSTWNEMLIELKDSAWEVWLTFFSQVTPYWMGHASETVQRYLRFELTGMFDELARIIVEVSSTFSTLAWDIVDYNTNLVNLMVAFGPAFLIMLPFAGTVLGRALLTAACFAFLKLLWGLITEFKGKMKSLDNRLEAFFVKMADLRGLFNQSSNILHLSPVGSDINFWVPLAKEDQ